VCVCVCVSVDLPGLHSEHVALHVSFLNFPVSQAVQGPPSGPLVPAPHSNEQSAILIIASGDFVRSGTQDKQFADRGA